MLPNFIGIGAYKSGTTWLFKCLEDHPDIFVAEVKETNFFAYYDPIDDRINDYEEHFKGSEKFKAIGEISNMYLSSEVAPQRIKKFIPDVKLFVSLRNPVDQVYSHYWHLNKQNFHKGRSVDLPKNFEDALKKYENLLLDNAKYSKHLSNWLKYFNKDQLTIIFYDDIVKNPERVISSLYSYVDVDSSFIPQSLSVRGYSVRSGRSPRKQYLEPIRKCLYNFLNLKVYYPLKQIVGVKNAGILKEKLRARYFYESLFFKEGYPKIKASTHSRLIEYFSDDIKDLEKLTGRDLSHWISIN